MKYTKYHSAIEVWHREVRDSWQIHFFTQIEADQIDEIRKRYKARGEVAPSYTAFVIKAIAMAINEIKSTYPEINAFIRRFSFFKRIFVFDRISCGCVASVDFGIQKIASGVILDPEKKSLTEITSQLKTFSEEDSSAVKHVGIFFKLPYLIQIFVNWLASLSSRLRYNFRGTYGVTSIGAFGLDSHTLPQSSSLQFGFGVVRDHVVARNGAPVVLKCFTLAMSFDRKLLSGKPPALVLARIQEILNNAEFDIS